MSRNKVIQKLWERRVVRFACIGVINTLTDLTILNILVFAFGLKLIAANCISASISIVISYFWNHIIVFQREHKMSLKLFVKFVVVTGLSILAVQTLVIYGVEHLLSIREITNLTHLVSSQARFIQVNGAKVTAVLVGMIWNFALYQLVVFKDPKTEQVVDDEGVVPY